MYKNYDLLGLTKAAGPIGEGLSLEELKRRTAKFPVQSDYATIPDYDAALSEYNELLRRKYAIIDGVENAYKTSPEDIAAQKADDAWFRADRPDGSSPASRAAAQSQKPGVTPAPVAKPVVKKAPVRKPVARPTGKPAGRSVAPVRNTVANPAMKKKASLDVAVWNAAADLCMVKAAELDTADEKAIEHEREFQNRLNNPNYTPLTRRHKLLTSAANTRSQYADKAIEAYEKAQKAREDYYKKNIDAGPTGIFHPVNSLTKAWNRFWHGDEYKKLRSAAGDAEAEMNAARAAAYKAIRARDEFNQRAGELGYDIQKGRMRNPYKILSQQVYTPTRRSTAPRTPAPSTPAPSTPRAIGYTDTQGN